MISEEGMKVKREQGKKLQKKYNQMTGQGLKIWKERDLEGMRANARKQCEANREKGPAALAKYRKEHAEEFAARAREHIKDPNLEIARKAAHEAWMKRNEGVMNKIGAKGVETSKRAKKARLELEQMGIMVQVHGQGKEAVERAEALIAKIKEKVG